MQDLEAEFYDTESNPECIYLLFVFMSGCRSAVNCGVDTHKCGLMCAARTDRR